MNHSLAILHGFREGIPVANVAQHDFNRAGEEPGRGLVTAQNTHIMPLLKCVRYNSAAKISGSTGDEYFCHGLFLDTSLFS